MWGCYDVDEELHRGRRSRVVRLRHRDGGPSVVAKMPVRLPARARDLRRLRREHELALHAASGDSVRPVGILEVGGSLALVMEDFGGVAATLAHPGPVGPGELVAVARAVARALAVCHARGVLHGDVSPANVLINRETGQVKLSDFGSAHLLDAAPRGRRRLVEGSLPYIAPEATGRLGRTVDWRADLYSLGATLYRLATGRPPFLADTAMELIHCHLAQVPEPVRLRAPQLPERLSSIVDRLLAKNPEDRLLSAEAVLEALEMRARPELRFPHRLFGREAERQALRTSLDRVAHGSTCLVALAGHAGVGKTALVEEMADEVTATGGRLVRGKHDPACADVVFGALRQALGASVVGELGEEDGTDDRRRAAAVRRAMVAVLASQARDDSPLVVFVDDAHWADRASVELFAELATAPDLGHVMVVISYRSEEVTPDHPLNRVVHAWAAVPERSLLLSVPSLSAEAVEELVGESLGVDGPAAATLGTAVFGLTGGNALFARELLSLAHRRDLVSEHGFAELVAGAGMAGFLSGRLRSLPAGLGRVLGAAAFIGSAFAREVVARVVGLSDDELGEALGWAVAEGVLVDEGPSLRFVHDRLREGCAGLVPFEDAPAVHLATGRALLSSLRRAGASAAALPAALVHLHKGRVMMADGRERADVARACLEAGTAARAVGAFDEAATVLGWGQDVLANEDGASSKELVLELTLLRSRCEHLRGNFAVAEDLLNGCLPRLGAAQRWAVARLRMANFTAQQRMSEALACFRGALEDAGESLPAGVPAVEAALDDEYRRFRRLLPGRLSDLRDLPAMPDGDRAELAALLHESFTAFFFTDPLTMAQVMLRAINLALTEGFARSTPRVLGAVAMVVGWRFGEYTLGQELLEAALMLDEERCDGAGRLGLTVFTAHVSHYRVPLGSCVDTLETALQEGLRCDDLVNAGLTALNLVVLLDIQGAPLERIHEVRAHLEPLLRRLNNPYGRLVVGMRGVLARKLGCPDPDGLDSGPEPDEAAVSEIPGATGRMARLHFSLVQLRLALVRGDLLAARRQAQNGEGVVDAAVSFAVVPEHRFLRAVALFRCLRAGLSPVPSVDEAAVAEACGYFEDLSALCPSNYEHKALLVRGLLDWLHGDFVEAGDGLARAAESAARAGADHNEALVCELAAALWAERQQASVAEMFTSRARECYQAWGASAKAASLGSFPGPWPGTLTLVEDGTSSFPSDALDVQGLLSAARAISAELRHEDLLRRILVVVAQVSGASRAVLVASDGAAPVIEAEYRGRGEGIPTGLVQQVLRTDQEVMAVLPSSSPFAGDPYFHGAVPRAVACVPIPLSSSHPRCLYLESPCGGGAFPAWVLAPVRVLAAQAAIAIENARLFAELEGTRADLALLNRDLEAQVNERTRALGRANADLAAFSSAVSHDLRNPLFALGLDCRTLRGCLDDGTVPPAGVLRRMDGAVGDMLGLIESLLALSSADRGPVIRESVHLSDLVSETIAGLRRSEAEREVSLVVAPNVVVHGDRRLLHVVVGNLVGNAWKFTVDRPGAVVQFGVRPGGVYFVADNGPGVAPEDLRRIFEPFSRVHGQRHIAGHGIGLATVERAVRHHGGRVWAESTLGQGTTVCFTLGAE